MVPYVMHRRGASWLLQILASNSYRCACPARSRPYLLCMGHVAARAPPHRRRCAHRVCERQRQGDGQLLGKAQHDGRRKAVPAADRVAHWDLRAKRRKEKIMLAVTAADRVTHWDLRAKRRKEETTLAVTAAVSGCTAGNKFGRGRVSAMGAALCVRACVYVLCPFVLKRGESGLQQQRRPGWIKGFTSHLQLRSARTRTTSR